ncbi:MAG: hypothetical protein LBT42_03610 [Tannerella sp.]|nr:hypothetical protein [Tannerella sp.]
MFSALVQTGYLTVKSVDEAALGEMEEYTLGIPNKEVNDSLLMAVAFTGKEIKCGKLSVTYFWRLSRGFGETTAEYSTDNSISVHGGRKHCGYT